jgi:putative nucleotidyltransferase with HDIG domain
MRMANSAYYGLAGRVRSCAFAVTVLGFTAVRSLAAASAAGALNSGGALPPAFWLHAATAATAAAEVAPRVGARHSEAFSLGLLHDLGRFLFHRTDPEGYAALSGGAQEDEALLQAERESYAHTHPDAAAKVLAAWRFPEDFTDSLARHHQDPTSMKAPLGRALIAGEALAEIAMVAATDDEHRAQEEERLAALYLPALSLARIDPEAVSPIVSRIRQSGEELAISIRG